MAETPYPPSLQNILDQTSLKWIFVGGKGGVGKTTTSSSLAVREAKIRKSVLLVSTDPAHNTSDAFGQKFGKEPTRVEGTDNLFVMEVSAAGVSFGSGDASKDDGKLKAVFDQLSKFFGEGGSIPGMDEFLSFTQMMDLITRQEFDLVIFDTAPTGHTLRLLALPETTRKALNKIQSFTASSGALVQPLMATLGITETEYKSILGTINDVLGTVTTISAQFRDPELTTFICVAIPEYLALYETERLIQQLARFEIDCHNVVVNFILDADDHSACALCRARSKMQGKYIRQFKMLYQDFHLVFSPLKECEVRGIAQLDAFGHDLFVPHHFCWQH